MNWKYEDGRIYGTDEKDDLMIWIIKPLAAKSVMA